MSSDAGYVNYFADLGLKEDAHTGEVRKVYRRAIKKLVADATQGGPMSQSRQNKYLLDMSRLNAALYVLKDKDLRETYLNERNELIELEKTWRETPDDDIELNNRYRVEFETKVKSFLSKYVEEMTLTAGQDKEVMEASNWDAAHARHATALLRYYRQHLYQDIRERLPYHEVTEPKIDWTERENTIASILEGMC